MITSADPTTRTYRLVFDLDFVAGTINCDDLSMGAGEAIPAWLWNHIRQNAEWRSTDSETDACIHVAFHVDFEMEDQRPDPNGIVPTARDIADAGEGRILTGRCDIALPKHSALADHLIKEYRPELEQYAEDNCRE